jgi:acetate kinase
MTVLALNAGSTSIKLALYDRRLQQLWSARVSGLTCGTARLRVSDATGGKEAPTGSSSLAASVRSRHRFLGR